MCVDFVLLAECTSCDKLSHKTLHARPPVVALDELKCAFASRVASNESIMTRMKNIHTKRSKNKETALVKDHAILSGKIGITMGQGFMPLDIVSECVVRCQTCLAVTTLDAYDRRQWG